MFFCAPSPASGHSLQSARTKAPGCAPLFPILIMRPIAAHQVSASGALFFVAHGKTFFSPSRFNYLTHCFLNEI
ncbi:hypothetical protein BFW38_03750 [Terasakiispira papahanaumokuakeensis]|uniref:Uncharacterized protein n=1 Tax=Terasakiispira papahanaumokuakeensis TaxID=197479 RepID=A0A1E2V729_9GAMM|nr:hypothetical protein BFW38_03750 [Terasakiispira papahanaumokuakeensis]